MQLDKNEFPKLSICIATYNRGKFIAETLDSIIGQMQPSIELIVVDGASQDNTEEVMRQYLLRHEEVYYYRETENSGVDRDYDKTVSYAKGEYCWLMTDDDLLCSGALSLILNCINGNYDLVVVNAEVRNNDFSKLLKDRLLEFTQDKEYGTDDSEQFFSESAKYLSFIGGVIIKRKLWLERDRSSYYGTHFIHVGVIFQHPPLERIRIISNPLIIIRYGNAMWKPKSFDIWVMTWPLLISSFSDFPDNIKQKIGSCDPWKQMKNLIFYRALGAYSVVEFRKFMPNHTLSLARTMAYMVSVLPGPWVNFIVIIYQSLCKKSPLIALHDLKYCPYSSSMGRFWLRFFGFDKFL